MPDDPRLSIPVLLGTIRTGRQSAHVARLLLGRLEGHRDVATELIDLADLDLPVMRDRLGETDDPPAGAVELSEKMSRADALVIVAPEYKNGYPGSLKNAFDFLPGGILRRKPIGIVDGILGRVWRAQLPGPVAAGLPGDGRCPDPDGIPVSQVNEAFDEPGELRDPSLAARVEPFVEELLWYGRALARSRGE